MNYRRNSSAIVNGDAIGYREAKERKQRIKDQKKHDSSSVSLDIRVANLEKNVLILQEQINNILTILNMNYDSIIENVDKYE